MFVIRDRQVFELARSSREAFLLSMAERVRDNFPGIWESLGEAGVRVAIEQGSCRAGRYGIDVQADICTFLDVMFTFGPSFDADLAWAAEVLTDPRIEHGAEKVSRLRRRALYQQRNA